MTDIQYRTLVRDNYRRLSAGINGFKPRREQNYLVAEIGKVLLGRYDRARRILVAEAGTGIGKSLAYLQAGIPWARMNQKKLVISTATLALQEQLVDKDLPLFLPYCQPAFRFVLAKGRARYCCARRLEALARGEAQISLFDAAEALSPGQQQQLSELWLAYAEGRWAGDRDSWPAPIDPALWQQLQAERHSCQPALGHQRCPFHLARAELEQADVIVVNHALLLADLSMGGGIVLPEPEQCLYILDEAHHIAPVAREQGSARLALRQSRRQLEQFNKWLGGLNELAGPEAQAALGRLQQALTQLIPALNEVYRQLHGALQRRELLPDEQGCLRFSPGALPGRLDELLSVLKEDAQGFCRALGPLHSQLSEQLKLRPGQAAALEAALATLSQQQLHGEQLRDGCELLLRATGPKQPPPARWLELARQDQHNKQDKQELLLCATPLAVGHLLEQWCWSRAAAVVMVSATLTALNDFGYFRRAVGLRPDDGSHYLRLNSPFDYQSARLIIPPLGCEPTDPDFDALLVEQIPLWLKSQGASLVLFSSYRQMNQTAEALRAKGHSLLVQGEASRQALLQLHRMKCDGNQPSVLFGTGSFAEGLDLPGHYLTNLIITKLPFAVPTSPVEAAMAEWISLCGGNPFMQLAMPEASRKLIQACGRLLRTETDSGRIVLLDKRLLSRRYGPALLDALPPFTRELG
ncbi:ATP-dependent DNA helicase DinG [Oceanisphaera psychrotolerans]|uniref:ATP-dependent DNA helicase DinG n=1 Tax=Oceanisphaera psychrotolerans TaxID=1414654 RepID=A0A1J4QED4_9GAMM|nr:ATP-dependent DNA helicase DinG [Oceanisphaera psychrotolerans]OIN07986.1 ATP-dependent DNA helicase DinG [Oceanisphaera psychrotolerans]